MDCITAFPKRFFFFVCVEMVSYRECGLFLKEHEVYGTFDPFFLGGGTNVSEGDMVILCTHMIEKKTGLGFVMSK